MKQLEARKRSKQQRSEGSEGSEGSPSDSGEAASEPEDAAQDSVVAEQVFTIGRA